MIDGLNIKKGLDPLEALRKAMEQFDPRVPVFHVVGEFFAIFPIKFLYLLIRTILKMINLQSYEKEKTYHRERLI